MYTKNPVQIKDMLLMGEANRETLHLQQHCCKNLTIYYHIYKIPQV